MQVSCLVKAALDLKEYYGTFTMLVFFHSISETRHGTNLTS